MTMMPLLMIVWAGVVLCFLGLLAYRATVTRYEDDQLFLDDSHQNQHNEQDEIVRKVNRMQPYVRTIGGAAGLMTASIIGIYVWDALSKF